LNFSLFQNLHLVNTMGCEEFSPENSNYSKVSTESGAIGEVVGIVNRGRSEGGGQHKTVLSIHRGMLFEAKVRDVVFNGPIGFQVPGELQRLAGFIALSFFSLAVLTLLFQFILTQGSTGRLNQAGIHSNAFVDGKPLLLELGAGSRN